MPDSTVDTDPKPPADHEELADILDDLRRRWRKADNLAAFDELDLTARELTDLLKIEMSDQADNLARLLRYSSAMGVLLNKLMIAYPALVKKRMVNGLATWTIFPGGWSSFSSPDLVGKKSDSLSILSHV